MDSLRSKVCTVRKISPKEATEFTLREFQDLILIDHKSAEKQCMQRLEHCTIAGIFNREELVGVVGCDAEGSMHLHIAKKSQYQWQVRSTFTRALTVLFTEHEKLSANFPSDNEPIKKLLRIFGWQMVSDNGKEVAYMLNKSDFPQSAAYRP